MGFEAVFHNKNYSIFLFLYAQNSGFLRAKKGQKTHYFLIFIIMQKNLSNKKGKVRKAPSLKEFATFEYFDEKCIKPFKPSNIGKIRVHKKFFKIFSKKHLTNISLRGIMHSQSQRKSKSKNFFDF